MLAEKQRQIWAPAFEAMGVCTDTDLRMLSVLRACSYGCSSFHPNLSFAVYASATRDSFSTLLYTALEITENDDNVAILRELLAEYR